jgi:S1-C subfamily serine protease
MHRLLFSAMILSVPLTGLPAEVDVTSSQPAIPLTGTINDRKISSALTTQAARMLKDGRATKSETLRAQLDRRRCALKLAKSNKRRLSAEELNANCRAGVVVVAQPYLCDHCDRTHCQIASGFMLTADGAFCTSYHVATNRAAQTMIILTGDGRIAPVREVLAADRDADLVILRAEGSGFTPLPLATDAPVGSIVRVISHPNQRFYSLTEGIVSRHFEHTHRRKTISMTAITADFAKGSSGAPVLNEMGEVIASVNSTFSSYYDSDDEGHNENLQMVFKNCVSNRHILELIEPK